MKNGRKLRDLFFASLCFLSRERRIRWSLYYHLEPNFVNKYKWNMSPALSIVDVYTILKDTQRWKEHDKLSQLDLIVGCGYYSTTSPDVIWPKASQISLLRICWCRMYEEKLYALGF